MKTALITGATDGIGRAAAKKYLSEGWKVVIIGRNPQKCEETISELQKISPSVAAIVCDLSILASVNQAIDAFLKTNDRLDLLLLNANAIANERTLTKEGHEHNFALGYLSRALMIRRFEAVMENTAQAQILSVVGMDYSRLDFEDLTISKDFTGRKGLTRWQWAMNVFTRAYKESHSIPLNLYMPGLVKTKILANEPQPMRAFVKLMNIIVGISPEKAADNIFAVVEEIARHHKKGVCYSWKKERAFPKVELHEGDTARLWSVTDKLLAAFG